MSGEDSPKPETEWQAIARGARAAFYVALVAFLLVFFWLDQWTLRHSGWDAEWRGDRFAAFFALIAGACGGVGGFFVSYYIGDPGTEHLSVSGTLRDTDDDPTV